MILLVAVSSLLRLVNLNSDLWLDEIGTLVSYVRLPVDQIVRTYGSMNQHLLYSVLARISVMSFGESAWALRLPAALFGIGTIPALYYVARVITSEREALLASALLTFSYIHIWFSQDARGYSAMVFFALLGTGFLFRAVYTDSKLHWAGYVLSMTLGIVSLQNTVFVVLGQVLCCMWLLRGRRSRSLYVSVLAISALSLLSYGLVMKEMIHFMLHAERTALGWTNVSELLPVIEQGLTAGFGIVGVIVLGVLGAAGWYGYGQQNYSLAGFLVAPVVLNVLVLMMLRIGAYPRSFLYELPFALLIGVRGATEICRRIGKENAATGVCLLLLAISSAPLVRYYQLPKQDFSGALAYVRSHSTPQDAIMAADLAAPCYKRYYFPEITIAITAAQIAAIANSGRTAWVLYSFPREFRLRSPDLFQYLRTRLEHVKTFPGTLAVVTCMSLERKLQLCRGSR